MAQIVAADAGLEKAADCLESGQLVAMPTETVYGLAGDATNGVAVAKIFETKGRPQFNPLIAHVSSIEMAKQYAHFDPLSLKLADAFWPGPLTLVLDLAGGSAIHPLVTAGLETVAIRMPSGFGRALVEKLGRPIAAPSANSSGKISPTTARAVNEDLGARLPLIIDAGATPVGVESTIVKVENGVPVLLRPGGLAAEEIERVAGIPLMRRGGSAVEAPGMMKSHYAPNAALRLNAAEVGEDEALLAFGTEIVVGSDRALAVRNLSESGDLAQAAANLFSYMRELDASGASMIAVTPVPMHGLGEAINDRLARAAAPRNE
ncbi:L-threonylcarbamoyladenylate synthase [Limoniibacter endophyticus]|uniref:Threonylcarbamoyl-AMP synthase n=1 Tax=Limoniibacter endophyticus TaxID=1565040 RepID=A0A8J3DIT2_9HYPH|nr:L-threonylcarbamoyladenylate synthase [Limoniibacter endophyticus]GHC71379.1 threonylcarbamoyl-AMP synthase [Limoniibacter endophyticus]